VVGKYKYLASWPGWSVSRWLASVVSSPNSSEHSGHGTFLLRFRLNSKKQGKYKSLHSYTYILHM
jgi:hypothetical protein